MLYASWGCGAASLVIPVGTACLHVRGQSCNYWFFFPGWLKDSCLHKAVCMSGVSVSKQSHQEAYNPSCRFTVNFLADFLPQFPALKLPYPWDQGVLSAFSEVATPFRDNPGCLQSLGISCSLVQNVFHLQQKLQCKGLSIGWEFKNTTH